MLKINYFILFGLALLFSSCREHDNNSTYAYSFDDLVPFLKDPSLSKEDSGKMNYCLRLNQYVPYGINFRFKFKDLGTDVRFVTIEAKGKFISMESKCQIVCAIDSANKNVSWQSLNFADFIAKPGEWTEASARFHFDKNNLPDNTLIIYAWNDGKADALVDDLSFQFGK